MVNQESINILKEISIIAGRKIIEIKNNKNKTVEYKKDSSPVTHADIEANKIIVSEIKKNFPKIPIISEESEAEDIKNNSFFLVDPLDGTKEFIKGSNEYTVNIALIEEETPILGIIYVPEKDEIFWNDSVNSYFENKGNKRKIFVSDDCEKISKLELSRSHLDDLTKNFVGKLKVKKYNYSGSSIKLCNLARGISNIYPRFGPTKEWDIAAGHAILNCAGGKIIKIDEKELKYRKPDFLNNYFVALGSKKIPNEVKSLLKNISQ